jgi:phage gp36-like protein
VAHPYTTRARVQVAAIARQLTDLLDRDDDTVEDDGVLDATIERACNHIDKRLGRRFVVPFDTVPGTIADIADRITIALLLEPIDARRHEEMMAAADADLRRILEGDDFIDAPERAADVRRGGVAWHGSGTYASGRTSDNVDAARGTKKSHGI